MWGFCVSEADELDLPSYSDQHIDGLPENHATVWFPMPTEPTNRELALQHELLAEGLLQYALAHGCLYRPDDPQADAESLKTA